MQARGTLRNLTARWLALLAIAAQALVVAPHTHPLSPSDLPTHHWSAPAVAQIAPVRPDNPAGEPFVPVDQCPLCQAFSLAGHAIAPESPVLAPPTATAVTVSARTAVVAVLRPAAPLGARAPPAIV